MDLLPTGLVWGLSRDFNASADGGVRAAAARSRMALGYPLREWHHSIGHSNQQMDAARVRMATGFDAQLQSEVALINRELGTEVSVAWDVCSKQQCDWEEWLSKRVLASDLKYAVVALVAAFVCICAHTRSALLGSLGALQIALSFPLALFVYRAVLGITLFGVLHVIGM